MIKIAACLLTVAAFTAFTACSSTQTAGKRTTLREMYANNPSATSYANTNEPAPPAEGPEAVGAGPLDPTQNPALVPTPLMRTTAMGGM